MWINTRRDVERPVSSVPLPQTLAPAMLWVIFSLEGTLRDAAAGGGAASPAPPAAATPDGAKTTPQDHAIPRAIVPSTRRQHFPSPALPSSDNPCQTRFSPPTNNTQHSRHQPQTMSVATPIKMYRTCNKRSQHTSNTPRQGHVPHYTYQQAPSVKNNISHTPFEAKSLSFTTRDPANQSKPVYICHPPTVPASHKQSSLPTNRRHPSRLQSATNSPLRTQLQPSTNGPLYS